MWIFLMTHYWIFLGIGMIILMTSILLSFISFYDFMNRGFLLAVFFFTFSFCLYGEHCLYQNQLQLSKLEFYNDGSSQNILEFYNDGSSQNIVPISIRYDSFHKIYDISFMVNGSQYHETFDSPITIDTNLNSNKITIINQKNSKGDSRYKILNVFSPAPIFSTN